MNTRSLIQKTIKVYTFIHESYKRHIKWNDIIKISNSACDMQPNDILLNFGWEERKGSSWLSDEETISYAFYIEVGRDVEETDEEYFIRMKEEENKKQKQLEKDKLEYLRLKAMFEPN